MAWVTVIIAILVAVAAFAVSYASLSSIGRTLGLAFPLIVPVMLDGAILAATGLVLVERARGNRGLFSWCIIYGATAASSAANVAVHAADGWLAASVAGIAPVVLLVLTHAITNVLVAEVTNNVEATAESDLSEDELAWAETKQHATRSPVEASADAAHVHDDDQPQSAKGISTHEVVADPDHGLPTADQSEPEDSVVVVDGHPVVTHGHDVVTMGDQGNPDADHLDHAADHADHIGSLIMPTDLLAYGELDKSGQIERRELAVGAVLAGDSISSASAAWAVARTSLKRWVDDAEESRQP